MYAYDNGADVVDTTAGDAWAMDETAGGALSSVSLEAPGGKIGSSARREAFDAPTWRSVATHASSPRLVASATGSALKAAAATAVPIPPPVSALRPLGPGMAASSSSAVAPPIAPPAPPPVALPEADDAVASKKRKVGETALAPTDSTAHLPRQPRGPIAETANAEDDGFRWSKCGQNTIEGAAFPRSFYRCISLRGSNCQCLKIIEGDPKDPGSGSVTYAGIHNHEPPGEPPAMSPHAGMSNLDPAAARRTTRARRTRTKHRSPAVRTHRLRPTPFPP